MVVRLRGGRRVPPVGRLRGRIRRWPPRPMTSVQRWRR